MKGARADSQKYNRFSRSEKKLDIRPVFYIAPEGENTEPDYFSNIIASIYPNIKIVPLKQQKQRGAARGNDPISLKERVEDFLKEIKAQEKGILRREAWVVVDRDAWTEKQLDTVALWVDEENEKHNGIFHGMALSNPCFEFWLLLHFGEGTGAINNDKSITLLKKHIRDYEKNRTDGKKSLSSPDIAKLFTELSIKEAIKRARKKDNPKCQGWPKQTCRTTVYILVERILNAAGSVPK